MATRIQLRRDTAVNWQSTNPVLSLGEPGVEIDTHNMKVGDGATAWNNLAYTAKDGGLTSVFVNVDDYYSPEPRISEDGIHWTAQVTIGDSGSYHSNRWSINSVVIGNGMLVYRGYNEIVDREELRYASSPYQQAITPDSDITRRGPNGENIHWKSLSFGGGYFVAGGWYYDNDRNDYRYPIAAYSEDGANWTKINIDLDFVKTKIEAQNNAYNNTVGGIKISSITYGTTGWLVTLGYDWDYTNHTNNNNRLNPGAFYITNITTALNSSSYFSNMPATDWSAWYDGHGWLSYYTTNLIYRNTSNDPRQGTWTDIDWVGVTGNIDFASGWDGAGSGDYYGVGEIAAGEVGGVNYMAISDYYGVVYYTADQGTTWNYVTPGPKYAGITYLDTVSNGGIKFSGGSGVNWGDYPHNDWHGEKITISGSYIVELNGTWWIDNYDSGEGNYPLYHDRAKSNRLDASGFDSLNIVEKYVSYGQKGDTNIVLPDTTNIVVGQRIYGIDAVRSLEDLKTNFKEPNIITAVNTDTNTITLKYPLYQEFYNEWIYFQALVKYTHGDNINNLIYGGGKFVATGNDSNRAYFTTNMTDWKFTQFAAQQGGFNNGCFAYGALDISKNALRNDSEFFPGVTNSLTLGDAFNVNVYSLTDMQQGMYDYYGATTYAEGSISMNPAQGWYMGVYNNDTNDSVAIYTYTGFSNSYGNNSNADDYYHPTSVKIETRNNNFRFDDYYGHFIADYLKIGSNHDSNDYYSSIDDIHFDNQDIYTTDGYPMYVFNYSSGGNNGGVYIHWDQRSKVDLDRYGVTITKNNYDWQFTGDNDGVLYAPMSSDIDIGGYWTIGKGNGSVGYPYIGAVNNLNTPQSDAYDFVIQAGQSDGSTVNNYWYFNRDGNMTLPPSGNIDVTGFWQIGNDNARIYADDIVTTGEVYDLVVNSGSKYWNFLQNGNFKLPAGGDIVNSDGGSVLNQDIPQNIQNTGDNYTLQLSDRGKHIYKIDTSGDNILIPTNASVAFPIGTCITLVTGDYAKHIQPVDSMTTTVILSKFGANANINVPADTYVTMLKIETDKWMIQT